jgi:hypothetical protein
LSFIVFFGAKNRTKTANGRMVIVDKYAFQWNYVIQINPLNFELFLQIVLFWE